MDKAIIVSSISVAVSCFALGWNFYRDVILKSRIKGHISISHVYHANEVLGPFISLQYVNHGPGKVHLESIYMAKLPLLRFLGKRVNKILNTQSKYAHIMWDYTNAYSSKLPIALDVGESATFLLKANQDAFLSVNPTHVGVTDSFGRYNWVSTRSLEAAKSEYFEEFNEQKWGEI